MGLREEVAKVLISVKADTSQAKAEVRSLRGEEKKAAQERLAELEKQNQAIDANIKKFVGIGAAVVAGQKAFELAKKAADAFIKSVEASGGAGSHAAKQWKDATKAWNKSVDDLLVSIGAIVVQLAPLIKQAAEAVALAAKIGKLPGMGGFMSLGTGMRTAIGGMPGLGRIQDRVEAHARVRGMIDNAQAQRRQQLMDEMTTTGSYLADQFGDMARLLARDVKAIARGGKIEAVKKAREKNYGDGYRTDVLGGFQDIYGALAGGAAGLGGAFSGAVSGYQNAGMRTLGGPEDIADKAKTKAFRESMAGIRQEWEELLRLEEQAAQLTKDNKNRTILETIFGTPGEVDTLTTAIGVAGQAFAGLTNAAGAAFDAWITGSKSIGQAFKEAIADALRALAVQALVESLKHGAFALGALAFGNFASAGAHGLAAAEFAGVAAAAGIGARLMGQHTGQWSGGTSGKGGGSRPSAGGYMGSGRGKENDGPSTVNIMLGSDFGMLTSIEQKQMLSTAISVGMSKSRRRTKRVRWGS